MSVTSTPLRYPGGKSKLYKYTKKLIESNNLNRCSYIEPFAGGCGLALQLLMTDVVGKLILNDIDRSIFAFWHSVLNKKDELIKLIEVTDITLEQWHIQKEIQTNKYDYDLLTLGFSTLYLNRTNISGIIKAGPIGGKSQNGNYLIDCRFNKSTLINKINQIYELRDKIEFYNLDAEDFIEKVIKKQDSDSLVFFDPPYYNKGPWLYENHYKHEDHVSLSEKISTITTPWIVTYDNIEQIRDMYSKFTQEEYLLSYSARKKCSGSEIMVYSKDVIPVSFE